MSPGSSSSANPQPAALLLDTKCTLGECATWCASTGRFYWTDIEGARLWRYDPVDGTNSSWPMPERLASFALCADPRFVLLGLASQLAFFNLTTGEIHAVVDVEPGLHTRVNDGRCDRQGRFVFGTKDDTAPAQAIGGFYRLNRDLSLERLPLPSPAIANSIAFSPDGATMYYCDSPAFEIRACDYHADGTIANDRVFVQLPERSGEPDGSTVDNEGGLWNAQWGGRRVVRYGPNGVETERVEVPTAHPSCIAFGGAPRELPTGQPPLDTLYVTSARADLDAAALAVDTHAGGVFVATPGRHGLPEPVFQGAPV